MRCGVPGDGADTQLAAPTLPVVGKEAPELARASNAAYRLRPLPRVLPDPPPLTQPDRVARARFTFSKLGGARFLSHRNVMDLLERALRAAAVPVRYTEGYNPHIRLSMGPALPLGAEALAERFDVECHGDVELGMLSHANRVLPEGLQLTACERLPEGAPSLGKSVAASRYRLRRLAGMPAWPHAPAAIGDAFTGILDWRVEGDDLIVTANARQSGGPTPGAKTILAALGVPDEQIPLVPVLREATILETARRVAVA
jgi:hypothetical protein